MNHCYKTLFNRRLGVWQAVSELARGQGKSSSKSLIGAAALAGALALAAAPAQAEIVIDGAVTDNGFSVSPGNAPSDPWIPDGDLRIGTLVSSGSLDIHALFPGDTTIVGESLEDTKNIFIGAGGAGTVTVDGFGAILESNSLDVGGSGGGTLSISNAAAVFTNSDAVIGSTSNGAVTVNGADTTWMIQLGLTVGSFGTSTLDIQNGGMVSSGETIIAELPGVTGTVTVDGENSLWAVNGGFTVGYFGDATLNITNGGRVETSGGTNWVGFADGSSTVTVDGEGSAWDVNAQLTIGDFSKGTLTITNGGNVSTNGFIALIGQGIDGTGVVTVDGENSTFSSGTLFIGEADTGTLNILNGGTVNSGYGGIGSQAGSIGKVTVDGEGSAWNVTFAQIDVGTSGDGTLDITGGGIVNSARGQIGTNATGTGSVTVNGDGSRWETGPFDQMIVGVAGQGTLKVENSGLVSNGEGIIGQSASGIGTVTVDGLGSQWFNTGEFRVGDAGQGTLNILNGGFVSSDSNNRSDIGFLSGAIGEVTVDGNGSTWELGGLTVGTSGTGTLTITDGGSVFAGGFTYIGDSVTASGVVTVDGEDSTLDNGTLVIGNDGTGTLNILNGGTVNSGYGGIGSQSGSIGKVTVDGEDSTWFNSGFFFELDVGAEGDGTLDITGGGAVISDVSRIGGYAGGVGIATVDGVNSQWVNNNTLSVGVAGTGTLNITGGGQVSAASTTVGAQGVINSATGGGTLTGNTTVQSGGTLAGASGSNLVINGNLDLQAGSHISATLDAPFADDVAALGSQLFTVNGTLTSDHSLIDVTNAGSFGVGLYRLIDYTGGSYDAADNEFLTGLVPDDYIITVTESDLGYIDLLVSAITQGSGAPFRFWDGAETVADGNYDGGTGAWNTADTNWTNVEADENGAYTSAAELVFAGTGGTVTVDTGGGAVTIGANGVQFTANNYLVQGDALTLTGATPFNVNNAVTATIASALTGAGGIRKIGTGTLVLTGASTYTGSTIVNEGTLEISGGGSITGETGSIGDAVGTDGTVTVDGANSFWVANDSLIVGNQGAGKMTITNGGKVFSAGSNANSIGEASGATGTVTVDESGSEWNTQSLYIGFGGGGTLNVTDGGLVSSTDVAGIGEQTGAAGTVNVDGAGSKWTHIAGQINVASQGAGTLNITDGGLVESASGMIGLSSTGDGKVVVDGENSQWTVSDDLIVGVSGKGSLDITNGGNAGGLNGVIGANAGSVGVVRVDGSNSNWGAVDLTVGGDGAGTLIISSGGRVSTDSATVGAQGVINSATGGGTLIGNTTVQSGGTLAGVSGSNLVINGNLDLQDGSHISATLDAPFADDVAALGSQLFTVNGALTSDGSLIDVTGTSNFGAGLYRIIDYTGGSYNAATNEFLAGLAPNGYTVTVTEADAGYIDLLVSAITQSSGPPFRFWDGSHTTADNNFYDGGTGTWNTTNTNWTNVQADENGVYTPAAQLVFAGTGGTVTVDTSGGAVTIGTSGVQFTADNYLVQGGALTLPLMLSGATPFLVNSGVTATINSALTGAGGRLGKLGTGTLVLTGTSTYTGLTVVKEGTLEISGGGKVAGGTGSIGDSVGDDGTVTVDGTGSEWISTGAIYVGFDDKGALNITNGGKVSNTNGVVGQSANSSGTVLVQGNGSLWENRAQLTVGIGNNSVAQVSVLEGGDITSVTGLIGSAAPGNSASGTVTIDGNGSTWIVAGSVNVGNMGNSSGTLNITDGGLVESSGGNIGGSTSFATASTSGTVLVDGTNSTWDMSAATTNFLVGGVGAGTLTISDGGKVVNQAGSVIGRDATGNGTVTVDGGTWTNTGLLSVGDAGTGELTVSGGGTVSSASGAVASAATSDGAVTVEDAGSQWNISNSDNLGLRVGIASTGVLNIRDGGSVTNAGNTTLGVNANGDGELHIENGGKLSNAEGYIAAADNAKGTVTVDGAGSEWTNSAPLHIGYKGGDGTLTITDGGKVSNGGSAFIGDGDQFTRNPNSKGVVTVDGGGQWISSGDVAVGYAGGTGTLNITDGGSVISEDGFIGYGIIGFPNGFSTGTVNVDGAGSSWAVSDGAGLASIYVGNSNATGTLNITDGGSVSGYNGVIGTTNSDTGKVTVDGQDSIWSSSFLLSIGAAGDGTLDITDGGSVVDETANIGESASGTGTVTVDGTGSTFTSTGSILGSLYVGRSGTGTLNVTGGGSVSSVGAYVGFFAGGTGSVTVSGVDSQWTDSGELRIGELGTGTLTVENSGLVSAQRVVLGGDTAGDGTLNLDGTTGARGVLLTRDVRKNTGAAALNFDGGILRATQNETNFIAGFAAGDATINTGGAFIDSNGFNIGIAALLDGTGGLTKQGQGTLTLSASNAYTGATNVNAGAVNLTGSVAGDVVNQATFNLNGGSVGGDVLNDGTVNASDGAINGLIENNAAFNVSGAVNGDGDFSNALGATLAVLPSPQPSPAGSGKLTLDGVLTNDGTVTVGAGAELTAGGINNTLTGVLTNDGTITDDLDNDGQVFNNGAFFADAVVSNTAGVINNSGTWTGDVLSNLGTINNTQPAAWVGNFTTSGIVNNAGLIDGNLTQTAGLTTVTGAISGTVTVTGGTLTGTGTVGDTIVGSGGTLKGIAGDTLTIDGDLDLQAGSHIDATLDVASLNSTAALGTELFKVNGTLTSDGSSIDITDAGNFGAGLYRIIDYTGGSFNTATNSFVTNPTFNGFNVSVNTADAGYIDLLITTQGSGGSFRFWDGAETVADGVYDGGTGIWNIANTNWTNVEADENGAYDPAAQLVFTGAAGTVTVDTGGGAVTIGSGGVQFVTDGYVINGGDLVLSDAGPFSALPFNVNAGAGAKIESNLTGIGGLNKTGAGTLTLTGVNAYTGLTAVNGGTLALTGGSLNTAFMFIANDPGSNGTLTVDNATLNDNSTLTVGGSGNGVLNILNGASVNSDFGFIGDQAGSSGTATVDASNWVMTSPLTVGGAGNGVLTIANGGQVSVSAVNVGSSAGSSGTLNLNGAVGARGELETGSLSKGSGSGALNFDGGILRATQSSATFVSGFGAGNITINAGGAFIDSNGFDIGILGTSVFGGTGGLTKQGAGTLTLAQSIANTYTGATNVAAGVLKVDGDISASSLTTVANTATLTGTGTVGDTIVGSGGTLKGIAGDTLTIEGDLDLQAGSHIDATLDVASLNSTTALGTELFKVNGTLTSDGSSIDITDAGNFGAGLYRIIDYTGGSFNTATNSFATNPTFNGFNVSVNTADAGYIDLLVLSATPGGSGGSFRFWDGAETVADGVYDGGTGTWSVGNTNWTNIQADENGAYDPNAQLVFTGTAGTVTVDNTGGFVTIGAGGVQFVSDGYLVQGGDLTIGVATPFLVNNGVTATIDSTLGGFNFAGINKVGAGRLILTGTSGLGGDTVVDGGTLEISGGGSFRQVGIGIIGDGATANGTVTVDGATSKWVNDSQLWVGNEGTGALNIRNGGTVTDTDGIVGVLAGSTGTATVDGNGSTWTNSEELQIGGEGAGTLTISNGGAVSNTDIGVIGAFAGSTGAVTVDGNDSTWDSDGGIAVGGEGSGTLTITNRGAVSNGDIGAIGLLAGSTGTVTVDGNGSTWDSDGGIAVGGEGSGTLTITDGGAVSNGDIGSVGAFVGSDGTVTVDGSGSTWDSDGQIIVGGAGSGTLTITDGGAVSNAGVGSIGALAGSDGEVTVDGNGSTWSSGDLVIGLEGSGTLTITNRGSVSNTNIGVVGALAGSDGAVTVDGNGSKWTGSTQLQIGNEGTGTLDILNGGVVSNTDTGIIGNAAGAVGEVTVDGGGSQWNSSTQVWVGANGKGTLNITDGGVVSSAQGFIAALSNTATGDATVDGAGSQWNNSSTLHVGTNGKGTLTISDGGVVTSGMDGVIASGIGFNTLGVGTATVTGAGSQWINSGAFEVGRAGNGTLFIQNGGSVSDTIGVMAVTLGSVGTATVNGTNSQWVNSDQLQVGVRGTGTLTVQNGGRVSNSAGVIGAFASAIGNVTVEDAGSQWNNGAVLQIAGQGTGTLTVRNGGLVNAQGVVVGAVAGSNGTLNLDGTAIARGTLQTIGVTKGAGAGALNFDGGILRATQSSATFVTGFGAGDATIDAGGAFLDSNGFDIGVTSALDGAGGLTKQGAGTLTLIAANTYGGGTTIAAGTLQLGDGNASGSIVGNVNNSGVLAFNRSDAALSLGGVISGGGAVNQIGTGTTTLTATSSYTGATNVNAGTLKVDGDISTSSLTTVANTATLTGTGTAGDTVVLSGGILKGASGSKLTINGDLDLRAGSHIDATLGAASAGSAAAAGTELFKVNGVLTSNGSSIDITDAGNFGAGLYRIIDYTGGSFNAATNSFVTNPLFNGFNVSVNTAEANYIDLLVSVPTSGAPFRFWDGSHTTADNNLYDGGTGTWNVANTNWTNVEADENGAYTPAAQLIFAGTGGTVTVDTSGGAVTIGTLGVQFTADSYVVQGGALTLTGATPFAVNNGNSATIASSLVGAGSLSKTGTGTLILSGANAYGGATTVDAGTLSLTGSLASSVTNNAAFTNAGTVTGSVSNIAGAIFTQSGGSVSGGVNNNGTVNANGGALNGAIANNAGNFNIGGVVTSDSTFLNATGATLTVLASGDYTLADKLTNNGNATVATGGKLTAGGIQNNGVFVNNGTVVDDLDNTGTYTNNGANFDRVNTNTGTINNNAGFNWTGDVGSNAGTINNVTGATWQGNFTTAGTVNNGGTITGTFTQTGGTTTNTGSISGATAVTNGLFTGAGSTGSLTLNNGATLAPGNGGIGAMTVNGNIVFNAGSVYQVETTPTPDQSDKINASGTATLTGGAVSVLAGAGDYALQTTYTILTANGGLGGTTFTGVTTDLAFLTPTLTYDATHAMLTLDRNNIDFSSVGSTRNQRATGEDVETLGSGNAVWDAVVQLTDDTARGAFDQMSGEIHASAKGAMLEDSRFVREMALDRSQQTAGSGPWASAFGSWATDDSDGNAAKLKRDVTGVFIGADTQAGDWHLGGLLGYSQSDLTVDARNSSGDTHDFHLGAYGGTHVGAINLRLGAAHTSHSISTKRAVAFTGITDRLSASYNARTTQVFGEAGYGVALSAQTSVEPFVNLAYVNHATDAFHERGGVAALASEKSDSHHTAFSTAGIRAETKLDLGGVTAKARGSAGWHHAFGDTDMASTHAFSSGDVFTVYGVPVTRDALSLEARLDFELSPNATAGISYNGLHGSDYSDNGVRAEIKVKF